MTAGKARCSTTLKLFRIFIVFDVLRPGGLRACAHRWATFRTWRLLEENKQALPEENVVRARNPYLRVP